MYSVCLKKIQNYDLLSVFLLQWVRYKMTEMYRRANFHPLRLLHPEARPGAAGLGRIGQSDSSLRRVHPHGAPGDLNAVEPGGSYRVISGARGGGWVGSGQLIGPVFAIRGRICQKRPQ